ncbi:hypothetical protein AQUCO_06100044v1 [Aquilegia coerulea]|uniref:Uncharacterized protein n=1 Tax=Aquilegia coerulea TaxID=218851 RepID=A0A2G5CDA6_AQUCA|nr:hypothetical protein AQUCO_06100044v1 [Aquilegia coerulea]
MEYIWKDLFVFGSEVKTVSDAVHLYNWNFSNLKNAFEEGGVLHGKKNVYLFASFEPKLVEINGRFEIVYPPVIVAVVSLTPPSDKIAKFCATDSIDIYLMEEMNMDWVPFIPPAYNNNQGSKSTFHIFMLRCTQPRGELMHPNVEQAKRSEYWLPYLNGPVWKEIEKDTVIDIHYPADPAVVCKFDLEHDDLEEFVDAKLKNGVICDFIKKNVIKSKEANQEAKKELTEKYDSAYKGMWFYKFYPVRTPDTPNVSNFKAGFINSCYPSADEVF